MSEIKADLRSRKRSRILPRLGWALVLLCATNLAAQAAFRPMLPGKERTGDPQAHHILNMTIKPPGPPSNSLPPAPVHSWFTFPPIHH
jgi:hypothetical protein